MAIRKIGLAQDLVYIPMKSVEIDGKHILVVKQAGNFFAIGDKCTHRGCKLSSGKLDGETVRCPCHGSVFNVRTGEVVKGPAKKSEPSYSVTEEKGELSIDM
jgi:nitrite reductase/ring-hydroxylating ferredoxin subunit